MIEEIAILDECIKSMKARRAVLVSDILSRHPLSPGDIVVGKSGQKIHVDVVDVSLWSGHAAFQAFGTIVGHPKNRSDYWEQEINE